MTTIAVDDITIDEHPDLSPYVLSSLSLPGGVARQNPVPVTSGGVVFIGDDVGEAGTISFECHIIGASTDDCVDLSDALEAVFGWSGDAELTLGMGSRVKVYRGRPSSCVPVLDGSAFGLARCSFAVSDPRWFAPLAKSVNVAVASMTGGMTTPMVMPMVTTGSGSTGDAIVTNDGTADAPWTAYIAGPVTTPRLMLGGRVIELLGDVPAGSVLALDSYEGTIRLDGAARPWKSMSSEWWEIPPGTSTFSFRAAAGTGTATLIWQDASK